MNLSSFSRSLSSRVVRRASQFGLGACLAALTLFAASSSFAQGTFYVVTADNRVGTVNVSTGAYTNIGDLGLRMTDIAVSSTGALYGISPTSLYSINATTGAASLIANTGLDGMNALVFRNNTLYTAGYTNSNLYTLNLITGASTLVGNIGFQSAGDLAFDNFGDLYMSSISNQLIRINTATGVGTAVGPFSSDEAINNGTDNGNMYGMAFQSSGQTLFGFSVNSNSIVTIDRTTGAATTVAANQGPVYYGAAFAGEANVVVPEANTAALLGLALPMIGAVVVVRRRKK